MLLRRHQLKTRGGPVGIFILALIGLQEPPPARAAEWRVEAKLGVPWNAPLPLVIRQDDERLHIRPNWKSRALRFPLYYAISVERERWSLALVHHKLYLENPPPEVSAFAISHGYNLLLVSHRSGDRSGPRLGAGLVIAHPENVVRGRPGPDGYVLAGGVMEAGVWGDLGQGRWRMVGELAASAAWARVPVAGGHADVPNLAIHARLGPAFEFAGP